MGEPRRVELMTVGPLEKEKKVKKRPSTVRFSLDLTESTDKTCPEFSYAQLLKKLKDKEKKERESKPDLDPNDPFAEADDEEHEKLLAIARSFEERYAPAPGKKKKYQKISDLVDLGDGYDETDPFVDNSEAYDEVVPSCLTTKFGGFYINSGMLDFREVSGDEDSDDAFQVPKTKKKKVKKIESDDEEQNGEEKKKIKKKKFKEDGIIELKKKRKKLSSSGTEGEGKLPKKKRLITVDGFPRKRGKTETPEWTHLENSIHDMIDMIEILD